MKNLLFYFIAFSIIIISCDDYIDLKKYPIYSSYKEFIGNANNNENLLEKYNLSIGTGIWNDYMPTTDKIPKGGRYSICTIHFDSVNKIPAMGTFAKIETKKETLQVSLYDIYDGKGTYGLLYRKDFRPIKGIRLKDNEKYTITVYVKINNEYQIIIFDDQYVGVTH